MKLSNTTYDVLKFLAQVFIPAVGTLWYAVASIWNLPLAQEILGTITAIDCFLGALLGISTMNYNKSQREQDLEQELLEEDE